MNRLVFLALKRLVQWNRWYLATLLGTTIVSTQAVLPNTHFSSEDDPPNLQITYLGNEGVMISSGKARILIDALHGPFGEYIGPPTDQVRAMQKGLPPYNGSEILLVTHRHKDHFSSRLMALHLENNKSAVLVCPQEVATAVRKRLGHSREITSQIKGVTIASAQRLTLTVKEVRIEVL